MRGRSFFKLFTILFSFILIHGAWGQVDFPSGSPFRYLKGSQASGLSAEWMQSGFDDSGWSTGDAPLRYGDGVGGTLLSDMQNNYSVVYMRATFHASHVDSLRSLLMEINYDDGFAIWINGIKVLSRFAPALLPFNGFATELHESGTFESFELDPGDMVLAEGSNTLAVQGFNYSLTSSDFLFDMRMSADRIEPVLHDSIGLIFSVPSGFYEDPFHLNITPADTAWDVIYTLDGSNPQVSGSAVISEGEATILIDPESTLGRPRTPAIVVRASAYQEGINPAIPKSRSYIFLEKVLSQGHPGGEWPTENINDQVIDLEMDSRIVNHTSYKNQITPALREIPSLSVVTDLNHLFDANSGIYVNAGGHGHFWERNCSMELIHPDGATGFNVNAGLRIRGGWSRHPEYAKHAFRLFFRSEYGDAKLYYPLFEEEGTDRYDKIDLRCAQNYAWSNGDGRNTHLRDVFSRDLQRDMGQPYTRSRHYHLYLNGMYWGIYQTQERSEARFAADYFGGQTGDYDVIKVNTEDWQYQIEATDGNFDLWHALWNMCNTGFQSNEDYFKLMGRDSDGNPVSGGQVYVEIDNLIDYMLTIFYTGNFDAPTSTFGWNKGPNNFFAINSRANRSKGFTFYNHDAEHSLFSEVAEPGTGLYEDRVNLTRRTDDKHMEVGHFGSFHPQWLHHRLTDNIEYRIRFMDRANLHTRGEGALTWHKNLERLNSRASEIDTAIVAESARWGDARPWVSQPHTKNENWIPQVQKIRDEFFPYRTTILIDQLREADLYASLEAPEMSMNGSAIDKRKTVVEGPYSVVVKNTNGKGVLCYTTNGTDPRQPGGTIASSAQVSGESQQELQFLLSAVVNARVYNQGAWSALKEVSLISATEDFSTLALTELHYHPDELVLLGDTLIGKDLEFIEFKNIGDHAINLSGMVLDSAIYYEFPEDALLPPGRFYVVASKPSAFYLRYGMIASGNFKKNLSNGGEEVLLRDRLGNPVMHFTYSDDPPWPIEADGYGKSLVSVEFDPQGDPANPEYWKNSYYDGGSPFENEPFPVGKNPLPKEESDIQIYPNPTTGLIHVILPGESNREEAMITLYGIRGNLILQEELFGEWIKDLKSLDLPSGFYIINVQTGARLYTRKIIFR